MINQYTPSMQQMEALVAMGIAKSSVHNGLVIYKYARKAFYDNSSWGKVPHLLECRGHVYDQATGEIVQIAPRKSFNYGELGTWENVPDSQKVRVYRKVNGFLACVTAHRGDWVVSTTGSLTSDFVAMAKEKLDFIKTRDPNADDHLFTKYFEIVHEKDPHIVCEAPGAYFLGARCKKTGANIPFSDNSGLYKSEYLIMTFGEAKQIVQNVHHEGFMLYRLEDRDSIDCCKLKSPYYIGKKKLMRMTDKQWTAHIKDERHLSHRIDARFKDVLNLHVNWPDWPFISEQDRGKIIDNHFSIHGW